VSLPDDEASPSVEQLDDRPPTLRTLEDALAA
jgi:hypothetical protein